MGELWTATRVGVALGGPDEPFSGGFVRKLAKGGKLAFVWVGSRMRFRPEDVEAFLAANRQEATCKSGSDAGAQETANPTASTTITPGSKQPDETSSSPAEPEIEQRLLSKVQGFSLSDDSKPPTAPPRLRSLNGGRSRA